MPDPMRGDLILAFSAAFDVTSELYGDRQCYFTTFKAEFSAVLSMLLSFVDVGGNALMEQFVRGGATLQLAFR